MASKKCIWKRKQMRAERIGKLGALSAALFFSLSLLAPAGGCIPFTTKSLWAQSEA